MGPRVMTERAGFESSLDLPIQRYLAHAVEHGLVVGLRSPEDFLRHFSPVTIMRALESQPDLRAKILQETTGISAVIAKRKSPENGGEDLRIAIDEGLTDAKRVVALLDPDERIRVLDNQMVWAYVVEPGSWTTKTRDPATLRKLRSHTAYLVRRAMDDKLLSARDVVTAISVPTLVDRLPREDVANVLERALEDGRQDTPFMDESFFEVVPLDSVVTHVPLATLWNWVLGAKIGRVYGLSTEDELFSSDEAHPDRAPASNDHSRSVTVVIDPDGTSPDGVEEPPLLSPPLSSKA